jgi:hypothetical protein
MNANFEGAKLGDLTIKRDKTLIKQIAKIVLSDPMNLNMKIWHSCKTVHCIAGWAVTLHPDGKVLEDHFGTGNAASILLGGDAYTHFYDSHEDALKYLKQFIKKKPVII